MNSYSYCTRLLCELVCRFVKVVGENDKTAPCRFYPTEPAGDNKLAKRRGRYDVTGVIVPLFSKVRIRRVLSPIILPLSLLGPLFTDRFKKFVSEHNDEIRMLKAMVKDKTKPKPAMVPVDAPSPALGAAVQDRPHASPSPQSRHWNTKLPGWIPCFGTSLE